MTDWRQIQARIRKAKNSSDAHSKLSELFQRTRDAMVAWELGVLEEKTERMEEAAKWYTFAAERFRRAEWKKKAEEALTRLGVALPVASEKASVEVKTDAEPSDQTVDQVSAEKSEEAHPFLAPGEIPETIDSGPPATPPVQALSGAPAGEDAKKKRRRGRRGGRGRRRKGTPAAPSPLPNEAFTEPIESRPPQTSAPERTSPERSISERPDLQRHVPQVEAPAPQLPSQRTAHGRAGDPALASRMAHLESMLRRLVASPLHRLDEVDQAPAGPGVFLLSDSDQITSYYIESCQTLRVGLSNLVRGGRGTKSPRVGRGYSDSSGLKENLSEHLGISESKVTQYMKDHCVVRWIQLDDDAPHLAHFAIGVLRPPLNLD
ncbi:MAG TPA: hypothetical protein VNE63_09780 [Candidatus Acidoferrales bacterium]|nr:hypothetical protein [Candidatus Acidoferrales bacterium]